VLDRKILHLVDGSRSRLFSILAGMYLAGSGYIGQVIFISISIEHLLKNGTESREKFFAYLGLALAMVPVRFSAALWQAAAVHRLSKGVKRGIREKVFSHIHLLGISYITASGTAELIADAVDGVESLEVYFTKFLPQLVYSMTTPVILFFVIRQIDLRTAAILTAALPVIPLILAAAMKKGKTVMNRFWKSYGELSSFFLDSIQGLLTLKLFGKAEERIHEISSQASTFRLVTMKLLKAQLTSITILDTLVYGFSAAGIGIGLAGFHQGRISISGILIIILLSIEFFLPVRRLAAFFHAGVNGIAAGKNIDQFLNTRPAIEDNGRRHLSEPVHTIEFQQVSFMYADGKKILSNASLHLERGKIYALIGASGTGKTTIAQLILRLREPSSGTVLINGTPSNQIPLAVLYERIALISSDTTIFSGTVADNLLLGNANASEAAMKTVCLRTGLQEFFTPGEPGLLRETGEGGRLLSGGQRQRLAIARMLLSNPDVILFDEATSSIDKKTEESIKDVITGLSRDHCILIISHRFSILELAEEWYMIADKTIQQIEPVSGSSERLKIYDV